MCVPRRAAQIVRRIAIAVGIVVAAVLVWTVVADRAADRALHEFQRRFAQIQPGMGERDVARVVGRDGAISQPPSASGSCVGPGILREIEYRIEFRPWLGRVIRSATWDVFAVCVDSQGRVVSTRHTIMSTSTQPSVIGGPRLHARRAVPESRSKRDRTDRLEHAHGANGGRRIEGSRCGSMVPGLALSPH